MTKFNSLTLNKKALLRLWVNLNLGHDVNCRCLTQTFKVIGSEAYFHFLVAQVSIILTEVHWAWRIPAWNGKMTDCKFCSEIDVRGKILDRDFLAERTKRNETNRRPKLFPGLFFNRELEIDSISRQKKSSRIRKILGWNLIIKKSWFLDFARVRKKNFSSHLLLFGQKKVFSLSQVWLKNKKSPERSEKGERIGAKKRLMCNFFCSNVGGRFQTGLMTWRKKLRFRGP